MSLAPRFGVSHTILASKALEPSSAAKGNVVELYLDYCCPFSRKLYVKWVKDVIPVIEKKLDKKFEFKLLQVAQPWHPSSILMHEAALAVAQTEPARFQDFSMALFEKQRTWFDENCFNKTRREIYEELASLAGEVGASPDQILRALTIDEHKLDEQGQATNTGNKVTKDLKYFTRYHRQNGVHMTPTVAVNGIILGTIGSGNAPEEVMELLDGATS
ncbi:LADA_0H06634g1_1 [Lachancea dasiensis]|uniref:LADA_0H06634g1_1 n=1 Tax=Lachancea dasiensis TaxID=1072105 RepID=A0A1G4K1S1_9SACH|nr:LADA_0H06634g1_1 [Lachancea dasiensis]